MSTALPQQNDQLNTNLAKPSLDDSLNALAAASQLEPTQTSTPSPTQAQAPSPDTPPQTASLPEQPIVDEPVSTSKDPAQDEAPPSPILKSVKGMKNIIDILLVKKLIDAKQARDLKYKLVTQGVSVEQLVVNEGIVSDSELAQIKSEVYDVPFVDLSGLDIETDVLNLIPADIAKRNQAVAFAKHEDGRIKVALSDPLDIQKVRYIETMLGKRIEVFIGSLSAINQIIDTKYGAQIESEVTEALEEIGDEVVQINTLSKTEDIAGDLASAPVSKIVNMILEYAIKYKSSDVHIEQRENKISVRFRVFGVLSEKLTIPKKLGSPIVSRIKILSNLKIDEKRVPQDGRFQVKFDNKLIDIRVSIMPTVYGEKVVLRLLEKGGGTMDLPETGLRGPAFKLLTDNLTKTQGIILITGPTGSGKTQTLASALKILNKPEVNIMTVEDPVEIRIDGVTQVQVNENVGLTFAKALRSFLRQDPDIIMVGEIRDTETAELAIQASLTGHLVMATLHTNSAAGGMPRLLDMGMEPFLLASTINLIIGQRLVRVICSKCITEYQAPPEVVKEIHRVLDGLKGFDMFSYPKNRANSPQTIEDDVITLYRGRGCPHCNNTGYDGRSGIFEALLVTQKIGKMIMENRSADEIEKQAISEGMITMMQDGFLKVLDGITTMEEVLRVIK